MRYSLLNFDQKVCPTMTYNALQENQVVLDTWLEVRSCAGARPERVNSKMLEIPVLAEALQAAKGAGKRGGTWDYSRKLDQEEVVQLKSAIQFSPSAEDYRSVSVAADVEYDGSCYSLTLFSVKTQ
jgi:hypothetical protein